MAAVQQPTPNNIEEQIRPLSGDISACYEFGLESNGLLRIEEHSSVLDGGNIGSDIAWRAQ